jgi:hypothetical protein
MSDYTLAVAWSGKDALSDSDSAKVISGDDFDSEFTTIRTAVNSKADIASPTLTGTPAAPTAAADTNTTQIATTAFVTTAIAAEVEVTAAIINALVYPVGSLYFNMAVSTNPNTLLGMGTWVAYAEGEVLVGKEASGTFDTLDESLGAETASSSTTGSTTLSTSQMPAHTHTFNLADGSVGSGVESTNTTGGGTWTTSSTGGGSGHTHTTPAVSTLQPSVTVYIWKRTA